MLASENQIGQLLTVQEVMARLKVGKSTVYNLINAGQLELLQVTTQKSRVTERSLEAFLFELAKRRNKPEGEL